MTISRYSIDHFSRSYKTASLLAVLTFCPCMHAAVLRAGDLLVPNIGLNALQEISPSTGKILATIPIPAGYALSAGGISQLNTVLVRSDGTIFTNVLDSSNNPTLLALSSTGALLASQASGGQYLQQLAFDPTDDTQSTILGGIPFSPDVVAINPFTNIVTPRVTLSSANFIGLVTHSSGHLYCGDYGDGIVYVYNSSGARGKPYVNVGTTTGSGEINALAFGGTTLYVAQNSSERIAVFDNGAYTGVVTNAQFNHPSAIFYDAANSYLYVGNQDDGYLTVLTTTGALVYAVDLGGSGIGAAGLIPRQN